METPLTSFEKQIVFAILKQHQMWQESYSALLNKLRICLRENTGVGAYVNFCADQGRMLPEGTTRELGFEGEVSIPGVPSGLGCVLATDDGRLTYLEFFTYGNEPWDGNTHEALVK